MPEPQVRYPSVKSAVVKKCHFFYRRELRLVRIGFARLSDALVQSSYPSDLD